MTNKTRTRRIVVSTLVAGVAAVVLATQLYGMRDPGETSWKSSTKLDDRDPGRSKPLGTAKRGALGPAHRHVDPANSLVEEWSLDGPPSRETLDAVEASRDLTAFVDDGEPGALDLALSLADPNLNGEIYEHCGPVYAPKNGSCHLSVITSVAPGPDGDLIVDYAKAEVHEGSDDDCKNYAACLARESIGRTHPSHLDNLPLATRQAFTAGPWDERMENNRAALEACIELYGQQVEEIDRIGDDPPEDMPDYEFVAGLMRMQLAYCETKLQVLEAG